MDQARQRSISLRSYQDSFEPKTAKVIGEMIEDLAEIGEQPTNYRLYTFEIQRSLSVGLLLAAVSVSTALLELFIRDLAVAARIVSRFSGNMLHRGEIERELEEDKVGFVAMLEMIPRTVMVPGDAEELRQFYEKTRIPFAHGLVRRLTFDQLPLSEVLDTIPEHARTFALEDRIESYALTEIAFVLRIMKRYQPWLIRRY